MKVSTIIPAAGLGKRFGEKKQFKKISGRSLLTYTIEPFLSSEMIDEIIVVVPKIDLELAQVTLDSISGTKILKLIHGGDKRQDSVRNGLSVVDESSELVCIHDGARPFITTELIDQAILSCRKYDGVTLALRASDTVKYSRGNIVEKTIDRNNIWLAQTPQVFKKSLLLRAFKYAEVSGIEGSDECSIMEKMGFKILLLNGSSKNLKITHPDDWSMAKGLF